MEKIRFRWLYLAFPLLIFIAAVVTSAVFYGKLPLQTGYRFSHDVAVSEASRGAVLGWGLGLQAFFTLVATMLVLLIISAGKKMNLTQNSVIKTVLGIMGNMLGIPQIIIYYATLDIFLYNVNEKVLPETWIFGIAVLVVGGLIIVGILVKAYLESRLNKT